MINEDYEVTHNIHDWAAAAATLDRTYLPGYGPRNPAAIVDGHSIDRAVGIAAICSCGRRCRFRAYHLLNQHGLVAERRMFSVCFPCNKASEF